MVPPTSGAAVARLGISKDRPVSRSEASRAARPVTNIPDPLPCHSRHTGFRSRFHLPLHGRLVYVPDLSEFLRARLWHAQNSSKNRFALASRSPRIAPSSSERSTRTSRAPTSRCAARQSRVCHQCWRLRRLSRQPIRCGHPHAASGRWRRAIDTATRRRAVGRERVSALVDRFAQLETCDLLIPDSPIARTRSSTRRSTHRPFQASWITAISAFSELLRASRNGGK